MKLAVRGWGEGSRRALLLHGIQSNAAGWWRLGPDLAARGYSVVAPDLGGHGDSPDRSDHSLTAHATDLLELGTEWTLVLGHSWGGALALSAVKQQPDFAARLVLEDPALAILDVERALAWLTEGFDTLPTAEAVAAANPNWHPEDARMKAEALAATSREVTEAIVRQSQPWNLVSDLAAVTVPTLLVGADPEGGAVLPPELGERLATLNDLVQYRMIPGSSHSIHRDRYEPFLRLIDEFLAEAG